MKTDARNRTFDEMLDALGHVRRRKLLTALLIHNPLDDESIAVAEDESADEELTRVTELRHVHLPKLDAYGFIDWNRDANEVSKGPDFEEIRPLLELLHAHEDERPDDWL